MQRSVAGRGPHAARAVRKPNAQRYQQGDEQQQEHRQQHPANQSEKEQQNGHKQSLPFQLTVVAFRLLRLGALGSLAVKRWQVGQTAEAKDAQKCVRDLESYRLAG